MPSPAEPVTSRAVSVIRDAIDPQRFSWIRPLVTAYSREYARVAPLFAGDPSDPAAWRHTIARVTHARHDRAAVHAALVRQLTNRGAAREAHAAADELAAPTTVAVVTGQQAGLFGGPLYTLLKAVTAIQVARDVRRQFGVAAVPVFWVEIEDHDWAEVRSARVLDKDGATSRLTATDPPGAGSLPVGKLTFDDSIAALVDKLGEVLAPTEFTNELLTSLRQRYRPGARVGTAFAGWIEDLLGRHGLVVFEADDPALKPLVADIFARELQDCPTARLARESAANMTALGHTPQVEPAEDAVALFYLDDEGRRAIRRRGDGYAIGDTARAAADLQREAREHPERFSPNVLLRPLVQDRLFSTVCYVAGPAELAYQAQIGPLYREFGVEPPLLLSRSSATLLDAGAARFFDKSGLPLESLQPQDDGTLNRLLEQQLAPGVERTIADTNEWLSGRIGTLKDAVVPIDPTLAGAVDTTVDKLRETIKTLHNKVIQAAKRKDETLRRQFVRTRALVFPDGDPQERALAVAFFINRYGLALPDRLVETLPFASDKLDKHYVLTL